VKAYRPPGASFKFPFRKGPRSQASGHYNAPKAGRPSKSAPSIKQFTAMKPGRPAKRSK